MTSASKNRSLGKADGRVGEVANASDQYVRTPSSHSHKAWMMLFGPGDRGKLEFTLRVAET